MVPFDDLPQNQLVAMLPRDEWATMSPHLEFMSMPRGLTLYEPGDEVRNVYFPVSCSISVFAVLKDGSCAEIATVGREGMIGVSAFMGGDSTPSRAVVDTAGCAYRMKGAILKREFNRAGALQRVLLLYTQAMMAQVVQTAACNRRHSVQQQLCQRLLRSLDRGEPSNVLAMTHETIGNMLGVRREGVSEAAGKLQRAGIISYSRGRITILDRAALEECVCECYQLVKSEFGRLLPGKTASKPMAL